MTKTLTGVGVEDRESVIGRLPCSYYSPSAFPRNSEPNEGIAGVGGGGEKQLRGRPKALMGTAPEGCQSLRVWGGAVVSI